MRVIDKANDAINRSEIKQGQCYKTLNGTTIYMATDKRRGKDGYINAISLESGFLFHHTDNFKVKLVDAICVVEEK